MRCVSRVLPAVTALAGALAAACSGQASAGLAPGGVGAVYALAGTGTQAPLQVQLLALVDPDRGRPGAPAGTRYVSVRLQITDEGTVERPEDPGLVVDAVDSAGHALTPVVPVSTAAGAQLAASTDLVPGVVATGYVTFVVPDGGRIVRVDARVGAGSPAVWSLPSP